MADIKDVSHVIQSALAEIGVHGELQVEMDGDHIEKPIGTDAGDEMVVNVVIADEPAPMHVDDGRAI